MLLQTEHSRIFSFANRIGQRERLTAVVAEQMKSEPLGGLLTNAGKMLQFVDQTGDRGRKVRHGVSVSGKSRNRKWRAGGQPRSLLLKWPGGFNAPDGFRIIREFSDRGFLQCRR